MRLPHINGKEKEQTQNVHINTVTVKEILDGGDRTSVQRPNLAFPRWKSEITSKADRTSKGFGSRGARNRTDQDTQDDEEETRARPSPELMESEGKARLRSPSKELGAACTVNRRVVNGIHLRTVSPNLCSTKSSS